MLIPGILPAVSSMGVQAQSTLGFVSAQDTKNSTNGVDQIDPLSTSAGDYGDSSSASITNPSASGELALGVFSCETCTSVTFSPPTDEQRNLIAGEGNMIGAGGKVEGDSPQVTISASLGKRDHWAMGTSRSSRLHNPFQEHSRRVKCQ